MNIIEFRSGMKTHFNITNDVNSYLVKELLPFGVVALDVVKFDEDFLIPKFGDYTEEKGMSMKDIITEKYGKAARDFVENAI
jgi:hypothetical protein